MKTLSDLVIDLKDFEINQPLGNGSYGIVYLVKQKSSQKLYAAKIINKEFLNHSDQKLFFRELESFSKAKN